VGKTSRLNEAAGKNVNLSAAGRHPYEIIVENFSQKYWIFLQSLL
jgi:hypothetical protein